MILAAAAVAACERKKDGTASGVAAEAAPVLRVGFFPNLTHAQGLIGYNDTQTKGAEGWFESRTGARIEWYPFNAGPSAIEGLLIGTIDLTYVGPNPTLNGYTRSKGGDIRALIGAARGGSSLVVQKDSGLKTPPDFRGKKLATPQLAGTQDVAARAWLKAGGLVVKPTSGDVLVIPTQNPDQLALFQKKELDAAWTVEPWVSRLELEAEAVQIIEEKDELTTLLVASVKALANQRELVGKFIAAHEELTRKVAAEPAWAKPLVSAAIQRATTRPIAPRLLDRAWPRLTFTTSLKAEDFTVMQRRAREVGLLAEEADLAGLMAKP
jgi:NitT/TauT family transport system substrate-binding protein